MEVRVDNPMDLESSEELEGRVQGPGEGAANVERSLLNAAFTPEQTTALTSLLATVSRKEAQIAQADLAFTPTSTFRSCNWHQATVHFVMAEVDAGQQAM